PTRPRSSSQNVALAPFSQNSKRCGSRGLAQAQLAHMKPSGLFCRASWRIASTVGTAGSAPKRSSECTEPQPPAGCVYCLKRGFAGTALLPDRTAWIPYRGSSHGECVWLRPRRCGGLGHQRFEAEARVQVAEAQVVEAHPVHGRAAHIAVEARIELRHHVAADQ